MTSSIPRYLIGSTRSDAESIKDAFGEVFEICMQRRARRLTLLVPVKKTVPGTVVGRFLGGQASKDLLANKAIAISGKLSMDLESVRTFQPYREYGVIMGIHLSARGLDVMDSTVRASALVFLPWTEPEGRAWLDTWDPILLGESDWRRSVRTLPEELAEGLSRIASAINISTGLAHPSDKALAARVLQDLGARGLSASREEIRSWALQHGWNPKSAGELADLSQQCL